MGKQKGIDNLEDLAVDGMVLTLIFKKHGEKLGYIKVVRCSNHRRETSGSITCGNFTDWPEIISQSPS
jgi:hypothetical protein